jgi:predicted PurR-regulated permease PerM
VNLRFWQRIHPPVRPAAGDETPTIGSAQLAELSTVFASPRWLRDLGRTAWLLVGTLLLLAAVAWLLGATYTIGGPMVAAGIVATVASPLVALMQRHRIPRAVGAVIVLLLVIAVVVAVVAVVVGGLRAQRDDIAGNMTSAVDKLGNWLSDLGVDDSGVSSAENHVTTTTPDVISTLTQGILNAIQGLASLAFALSFAMLGVFFFLKDGPTLRRWIDGHIGLPQKVAETISGGVLRSLRGYFLGVTIVALFNGVVVGIGALLLGVPLAGTIAVVTVITAYIPYIGAFVSGAFAVLIALGAEGTSKALIMLVIVILANGLLQNIFQPFAMGSALHLHPLAVLIVTISAGCLFGMIGLVLAAPLTSAAVHITQDLRRARAAADSAEVAHAPPT